MLVSQNCSNVNDNTKNSLIEYFKSTLSFWATFWANFWINLGNLCPSFGHTGPPHARQFHNNNKKSLIEVSSVRFGCRPEIILVSFKALLHLRGAMSPIFEAQAGPELYISSSRLNNVFF